MTVKTHNDINEDVVIVGFGMNERRAGPTYSIDKTTVVVMVTIPASYNFDDETAVIAGDQYMPRWMLHLFHVRTFTQRERKMLRASGKEVAP